MPKFPIITDNTETSQTDLQKVAYLAESFSGIQGEGPLIGQRQIFLRFSGCDLRCQWCDTPASLAAKSSMPFRFEKFAGSREFGNLNNPVDLGFLANYLAKLDEIVLHESMSLTGGEPLLQAEFIKHLLTQLKTEFCFQPNIYLETGGHRPKDLVKVINLINFISFDLKLPSSTNDKNLWSEHRDFIEVANQYKKPGYAKSVLTAETLDSDLEIACDILFSNGNNFELILQPAYPLTGNINYTIPSPEQMLRWQDIAIKRLGRSKVRVIPQTHKFIGQL